MTHQEPLFDPDTTGGPAQAHATCPKCGRVIHDGQLVCVPCSIQSNKAQVLASQPERLRRAGRVIWLRIIKTDERHVLAFGGSDRITFCGVELQPKSKSKEVEYTGGKPKPLRLGIIEKPCNAETLATVCPECRAAIERALEPSLP